MAGFDTKLCENRSVSTVWGIKNQRGSGDMGYKKDVFGCFAYEFELLQKLKSSAKRIHLNFFTIHYYILPNRQVSKEKSEK